MAKGKLKPTGHSAVIEALIQPAIVVGSTLMSAIAAYVLGLNELQRILNGHGSGSDVFVVVLCAGMGFLIDMAIIVSATRFKMHTVRADPREQLWKRLALAVLVLGLSSESMTLLYFFEHLSPADFPDWLQWLAGQVHTVLIVARAFLPPIVLAYFVAGVLPVIIERGDRNRGIKERTSTNIMTLIDKLSAVEDTDDKQVMLTALGGQLMLDTYATYDATGTTTEADQVKRDVKLLKHLAKLNGLQWEIVADLLDDVAAVKASAAGASQEVIEVVPFFDHAASLS